jgi:RimJ/RimL family protein N-acetyltransferase
VPGSLGLDRVATPRLAGRRPEPEDRAAWIRWYTDPRIDEAAWPEHLRTADHAQAWLDGAIRHWERWGFGPWTVLEAGTPIGQTGLTHTRVRGRPDVELGWCFASDAWGRGYATEMAREAVRVAFAVLELDEVVAFTTPGNIASLAVIERLGMTFSGEVAHAGLTHRLFTLRRA